MKQDIGDLRRLCECGKGAVKIEGRVAVDPHLLEWTVCAAGQYIDEFSELTKLPAH